MKKLTFLLLVVIFISGFELCSAQVFYKGTDLSYVNEIEACAGQIYKENSVQKDIYSILSDNGANIARFRLWHTRADGWSMYNDVKNAIARAKAKGMAVILDFHYSDDWADPGTQCTPAAWKSVDNNYSALADSLYNYTYEVLADLKRENLTPEFVQVGNETNGGMCYKDCTVEWPNPWDKQTLLYNAGIQACRDIDPDIQIILHVSDPNNAEWWVGELFANSVTNFDVVGISHYPCWHGDDLEGLQDVISNIKSQYAKDVMVVETAVPWTDSWADDQNNAMNCVPERYQPKGKAISPSPEIASQWCTELADAIFASGGIGLVYWGGEWVATNIEGCPSYQFEGGTYGGSSWENCALFDFNNNLLVPGPIDFIKNNYGTTEDFTLTTTVIGQGSVSPSNGTYSPGSEVELTALPSSGWEFSNWSGDINGTENPVTVTINSDMQINANFILSNGGSEVPGSFNLIYPNKSVGSSVVSYDWEDALYASTYSLQVSDNIMFSNLIVDVSDIEQSTYTIGNLTPNKTYYWKVTAYNSNGSKECNEIFSFKTRRSLKNGISQQSKTEFRKAFKVYPNPASSVLNIDGVGIYSISVYNVKGVQVLNKKSLNGSSKLDVSNFNKGVYLIKISSNDSEIINKIIVE